MQQNGFRNKEMEKGRNSHFTGEVCDQADIGNFPIDNHNLDSVTHIMKWKVRNGKLEQVVEQKIA